MSLVTYKADVKEGGTSLYIFQRPSGARLEMRHLFSHVDPPRRLVHIETYDFSTLRLSVTTVLDEVGAGTVLTQTLQYSSEKERDDDFDGVASSAADIYGKLERFLNSPK
jgi:uncharacterized protein YndB with AHSA1/START domain